jgi:hypothetical protein
MVPSRNAGEAEVSDAVGSGQSAARGWLAFAFSPTHWQFKIATEGYRNLEPRPGLDTCLSVVGRGFVGVESSRAERPKVRRP